MAVFIGDFGYCAVFMILFMLASEFKLKMLKNLSRYWAKIFPV